MQRPIFPWAVALAGLVSALLLPFADVYPLVPAYVSQAFATEHRYIPEAVGMFFAYMFQHENTNLHWVMNFIFLFWFGTVLENAIGHLRMLAFILGTGVFAGLVHYLADPGLTIPVVGLSGVIIAVIAVLTVATPRFALVSVPSTELTIVRMWHFGLLVLGTQFYHFLQMAPGDKTAYWIHFGGVVAGLALWFFWLRQRIDDFKRSPAGEHLLQA